MNLLNQELYGSEAESFKCGIKHEMQKFGKECFGWDFFGVMGRVFGVFVQVVHLGII